MAENRGRFTLATAQAYLAVEPEMTTKQLSARLFSITDGQLRTIFIAADNSVIAFDTFGTPGRARAYAKAIAEAVPGKPIKTIIYTHDHLDHSGFAADLAPEADIIADEICAKVIKLREAEGQLPPTKTLCGEQHELVIDGVNLLLLNPGPTHGSGNIAAYFAEEKTLFSSDTILANARYGFMPDYHFCNFISYMRSFLALDWDCFIPGRYEISDRTGFEHGVNFIAALMDECQRAFVNFVPIWAYEPMKDHCIEQLADRFGDLDGFEDHVGQMAIRIVHHYLMGGWGLEDTPEPSYLLVDKVNL